MVVGVGATEASMQVVPGPQVKDLQEQVVMQAEAQAEVLVAVVVRQPQVLPELAHPIISLLGARAATAVLTQLQEQCAVVVVVARQFIRPAAGDIPPVPVVLEEEGDPSEQRVRRTSVLAGQRARGWVALES